MNEGPRGLYRAARLSFQLPKESRFIEKEDPSLQWDWRDLYLMMMNQSLRQLVWSKTKDASKKTPKNAPELIGPQFILKAIKRAEDKKKGKRKHTENARLFQTTAELDEYLKKPRKSVSK